MTNSYLVNLMPVNDANCLMMSQQLLKAVKRLSTMEKSPVNCLQMGVKLSPAGKNTTFIKLVVVVTVAHVTDEDRVGNSLLQILKLRFGHKA